MLNGKKYDNASVPERDKMLQKELRSLSERFEKLVESDSRVTGLDLDGMCSEKGENGK